MRKFSIGSTAVCISLAATSCAVSPDTEEENIGIDSEELSTSFAGDCPIPPPYYPPPDLPPLPACYDDDYDGVCDDMDICPWTVPDRPLRGLGVNHFGVVTGAVIDGALVFDTRLPHGPLAPSAFTMYDTGGCSCEQILYSLGGRFGQYKNGCSYGTMKNWVRLVHGGPGPWHP